MNKWLHYFDIYERHFAPYRHKAPTVLEIGIFHGGSLQMWREYFGRRATIIAIDIDERTKGLEEPGVTIEIGDQGDEAFLRSVAERYGPFDIVIDDGSHRFEHQITSIETLWPSVKDGGVYLVEDLHTSYWQRAYGGGLGAESSFIEWLKPRIDDMNAHHSREEHFTPNEWTSSLRGLHLYDSVAVLDKAAVPPPTSKMTGVPAFDTTYDRDSELLIDDEHRAQLAAAGSPTARLERLLRHPITTSKRWIARLTAERSARHTDT